MSTNYTDEWDQSYTNGDNHILYPQTEVIRFLNKLIVKRGPSGLTNKMQKEQIRGLDFACGIGTHALTFFDFDIEGYGVDISNVAINIAKQRAVSAHVDPNNFSVINSTTLPFEDKFFDFVVAESCLDSMPYETAKEYITDLKRVSKKYIYASFFGSIKNESHEFLVKTDHEKGTVQTVYNEEKICDLFNVNIDNFVYFRKTIVEENGFFGVRFYCVYKL